jgi:hypothetical protein
MNTLEHLVELVESESPSLISILAPVFNPTFLWKFAKEISLHRRKKLEEIRVFVLNFTEGSDVEFLFNECIELQELFPKIKIYLINLKSANDKIKMASGVVFMTNGTQKAYAFETEFSSSGFSIPGILSFISKSKATSYFDDLHDDVSIKIDRVNTSKLLPLLEKKQQNLESGIAEGAPTFELSFISASTKKIHNAGAGLNWGQPTSMRARKDLNAAYIHVPKTLQKSENLPSPGVIFSCKFDDGIEFEMLRTGDGGKNLTSAHENQILGRYIRHRLGVAPGRFIDNGVLESKKIFGLSFYLIGLNKFFVQFCNAKISKSN